MFLLLSGCQETLVESNTTTNKLEKETNLLTPTTDVHGYVTKDGSAYQEAKVELWKDGVLLDYTYSALNGFYTICVCSQNAGTGYYIVKTEIDVLGDKWACSRLFYWDNMNGPWDFEIDLPLAYTIEKNSN
jgi:hypothetical protein